jgi:hypothetical protein
MKQIFWLAAQDLNLDLPDLEFGAFTIKLARLKLSGISVAVGRGVEPPTSGDALVFKTSSRPAQQYLPVIGGRCRI